MKLFEAQVTNYICAYDHVGGLEASYDELVSQVARHTSAAHAALFAKPQLEQEGNTVSWYAPGQRAVRMMDLPAPAREQLWHAFMSITADIANCGTMVPELAALLRVIDFYPDAACIYAVDGRPVVVMWGMMHDNPRRFSALFPPTQPPRYLWWQKASAPPPRLLATAVIATVLGLIFGLWRLLAVGVITAGCPVASVAAVPPHVMPSRQDLWQAGDVAALQGCWTRRNQAGDENLMTRIASSEQMIPLQKWQICFDRQGHGKESIVWPNGKSCETQANAAFEAPDHVRVMANTCMAPGHPPQEFLAERFNCSWSRTGELNCPSRAYDGGPLPRWPDGTHPGVFELVSDPA